MAWIVNVILIQTFLSSLLLDATSALSCEKKPPVKELAYNAAYSIYFPVRGKSRQTCIWLISAYRKEHALRLRFNDVNMTQAANGSCVNRVVVYDGPTTTSGLLTSFCGASDVDLQTSSKQALVFVLLGNAHSPANTAKFHLKYNSFTPREDEHQVVWILAFVGMVAMLCCIAFCCGLLKCFVQWRSARISAQARAQPTPATAAATTNRNTDNDGDDGDGDENDDGVGGDGDGAENAAKNMSIGDRVWNLLERLFQEKHWWNTTPAQRQHRTTCRNAPSNRRPRRSNQIQQQQQQQQQQRRQRQQQQPQQGNQQQQQQQQQGQHHPRRRQNYLVHQPRSDAVASLDFDINDSCVAQTSRDGFSFQDIPVSSFTSDPLEVKPPSYEDCLKNTNPLYLYHHGGGGEDSLVFYNNNNRSLENKDDDEEPISAQNTDVLTPPPPYKEIDTTKATSTALGTGESGESRLESNTDGDNISNAPSYTRFSSVNDRYTGDAIQFPPPPPFTEFADPPLQSTNSNAEIQIACVRVQERTLSPGRRLQKDEKNDTTTTTTTATATTQQQRTHSTEHSSDTDNTSSLYDTHSTMCYDDIDTTTTTNYDDVENIHLPKELYDDQTKYYDASSTSLTERAITPSYMVTSNTIAAATANYRSSVPYAMMRRSGLITSLSDPQEANDCFTPVEECSGRSQNISAVNDILFGHANSPEAMGEEGEEEESEVEEEKEEEGEGKEEGGLKEGK